MKKLFNYSLLVLLTCSVSLQAKESLKGKKMTNGGPRSMAASNCNPGKAQTDIDINNVRARILTGGDMWWDLTDAKYEVPKNSGKHSMFAGSLWIGGVDATGQLKVAAATYRQNGNDFWPGALNVTTASVDENTCAEYDKHYKITLREVEDFVAWKANPANVPGYAGPSAAILKWPGNGNASRNEAQFLAPFVDVDGNGYYEPEGAGDYPAYAVSGTTADCSKDMLFGDQTLWWVTNDVGNIHTESGAAAIGLEIHGQAFAFATNDEINNMTFYQYKIFNRSTLTLNNTYFGQWVDADLGNYTDDYVGCDVKRGLGYCYNGKESDGTGSGNSYGPNPPAIGVDFFQGPLADKGDNIDNDRDGSVDEDGEQIIMSKFVYYNNDGTMIGNPDKATDFYNYLRGIWKDGTQMTFGGNGHLSSSTTTDFMFPGDTDPSGVFWDEVSSGNAPADRRFLQSAGAFTLQPGAVNKITTGVVWARATSGGPLESVKLLKVADDKAQSLFDNCFQVLNGPDAPDLSAAELDETIILYLTNRSTSNNFNLGYKELDPTIVSPIGLTFDQYYRFQGYIVYQVADQTVSTTDLDNPDKARLIAQYDMVDDVTTLVNYEPMTNVPGNPVGPQLKVQGANKGIEHSLKVTEDQFALDNKKLVNYKTYYFLAVSYAFNEFKPYKPDTPPDNLSPYAPASNGQKQPFKLGRRNIKVISAVPHIPATGNVGTVATATYGAGVELTRVEGTGNGGFDVDLAEGMHTAILNANTLKEVTYAAGEGPVKIKVIDPLSVQPADFEFQMLDSAVSSSQDLCDAYWVITNKTSGEKVYADQTITIGTEQLIPQWGISVALQQVANPGPVSLDPNSCEIKEHIANGFLGGDAIFKDQTKAWLTGVPDVDGFDQMDWVRSGTNSYDGNSGSPVQNDAIISSTQTYLDPKQSFEQGQGIAPYRLTAYEILSGGTTSTSTLFGPAWKDPSPTGLNNTNTNALSRINSIDLVITSDESKWSDCVVLEEQGEPALAEGGKARKLDLRDDAINGGPRGMGKFPGYAINVETGERLNIAFGEDSWLGGENGADMKWNPTSNMFDEFNKPLHGGKHFIYIFGHNGNTANDVPAYDGCSFIYSKLSSNNFAPKDADKRMVFEDAMWVAFPLLVPGRQLLETDVTVRVRVAKSFEKFMLNGTPVSSLTPGKEYYVNKGDVTHEGVVYKERMSFVASSASFTATAGAEVFATENGASPYYKFSTKNLAATTRDLETAKNALELIKVVPNPYYSYSGYEQNQFTNLVKITNLPQTCTISIYTLNGTLIRKISKDAAKPWVDWDLKNTANIPISGGMYIFHIDAPGLGEKIIKWFAVMRPIDLDQF